MGTGYTRNDTSNNIADGNVINASDLDGEFDAVQAAFNGTTGHSHDGTSGEGPQIAAGGIASNAVTTAKILDGNVTTAKIANDAVTLGTKTSGNYVAAGAVSGVGLSGSASAEGATFTVTSNATNANTANTIVARDASGNFSAGTITASLTGTASNANQLDSLDSTQFLRSDAADTKTSGNLDFSDNVRARFGTGADLQIYHNGSNSYIDDTGTGNLYIRASDSVRLQSATGEQGVIVTTDGAVTLYHDNGTKLATTATGVTVTGELLATTVDATTLQIGGTSITATAAELNYNDITTLGAVTASKTVTADSSGFINFADNQRLRFGAGADLQIYHNASNSYISDAGTGNLFIQASNNLILESATGENYLAGVADGSVTLYYDNAAKLATKSDGVDITGELQSDSLDVDGVANISGRITATDGVEIPDNKNLYLGAGQDLVIFHDGVGGGSYINESGSGNLFITGTNILLKNTGSTATYASFTNAGAVALYYNGGIKLTTKSDGVDITGELQCDSLDVDGAVDITGQVNFHSNVVLDDNDKIILGNGSDLQIYHDASASYISETGTGSLNIDGSNLRLRDSSGNTYVEAVDTGTGGTVNLYQNASLKLNTATDGIYVTGNVQSSTGYFEGANPNDRIQVNASSIDFYIDASNEFRMESDGDFHADANVIAHSTTVSDERLKENIEKIENATDKVSQLNGYTFNYKKDGRKGAGVIAQEVEKVLPSAVMEKQLPLKMDDGVAYKIVEYDQIIGLLIESIKELKQEINTLKGE